MLTRSNPANRLVTLTAACAAMIAAFINPTLARATENPTMSETPKPTKSGHIPVNGVNYYYAVYGKGEPLLLLHGHPQTHVMWHKIAPLLARDFTVVATDLRGYGDSSKPPTTDDHEPYSKRAMARDLIAVMPSLLANNKGRWYSIARIAAICKCWA